MYFMASFLDEVLNWLESGKIIYTKSALLCWKKFLSLFIIANLLDLKSWSSLYKYCNLLFSNV